MSMNLFAQITKVDEAKRLVIGRAVQEVPDLADEIFDYESSKPHFKAWSDEFSKDTEGKSLGNLRAMHGKVAAGKLVGIDFNDGDKAVDISAKVVDEGEWMKVLEGVYTGFSIGGSYVGERKTEKIGGKEIKRYTAKPAEISLVDSPCVPSAKFFQVHKADGSDAAVAFKTAAAQAGSPPPGADGAHTSEPASAADLIKKDLEVKGTDKQVADFAEFLNREGLSMADALERLAVEAMLDTVESMEKREFSADERKKAAKEGHALPDGSFPINTVSDLHNAIQAYGRAKDKAKAKAHIVSRAKALGASKDLPESWTKGEKFTAADEELIKSALAKPLIESDSDEAFSSNVKAEIAAGKSQEQAVAIAYSVQRKARHKKMNDGQVRKGLWNVGRFCEALGMLCEVARSAEYDLQEEDDDSDVARKLRNSIEELIDTFEEMSSEEANELLAELKQHAEVGPDDEIDEALEAVARHGALAKMVNDPELPVIELAKLAEKHLSEDERKPIKNLEDMKKAILGKARMTQAHMDKIQAIHDHSTTMGAECHSGDESEKVAKAAATAQQLQDALARIEKLEKQPVPHVVLTTIAKGDKAKPTGTALDDSWLTTVPYSQLIKRGDGAIDWELSAQKFERKRPA